MSWLFMMINGPIVQWLSMKSCAWNRRRPYLPYRTKFVIVVPPLVVNLSSLARRTFGAESGSQIREKRWQMILIFCPNFTHSFRWFVHVGKLRDEFHEKSRKPRPPSVSRRYEVKWLRCEEKTWVSKQILTSMGCWVAVKDGFLLDINNRIIKLLFILRESSKLSWKCMVLFEGFATLN